MRIVQISDTHNRHNLIKNLPQGDVIIHCGDISDNGTEEEVLDFLNWFIELPYPHKIFITGNHDLCLWDAENIEDLPEDVHFLQDRGITIDGISFFGLAYNHSEMQIPSGLDVLITHEPPMKILDKTVGVNWGNLPLRKRVIEVQPRYHLFGHAHEAQGILKKDGIVFSNGSLLNDYGYVMYQPKVFEI